MANLKENAAWESGIYQLETTDPVVGGVDGISNKQAIQLANRTGYLKEQISNLSSNLSSFAKLDSTQIQYFTGDIGVGRSSNSNNEGGELRLKAAPISGFIDSAIDVYSPQRGVQNIRILQPDVNGAVKTLIMPAVDGTVWSSGNMGVGSGLDADTLDGLDSTAFVQKNTEAAVYTLNLTSNNRGDNLKIGDDVCLGDIGVDSTLSIKGQFDEGKGFIKFGKDGPRLGNDGDNTLTCNGAKVVLGVDFACQKNPNGYTKLPNGLILQWGVTTTTEVIFPIAFNKRLNVSLTSAENECEFAVAVIGEALQDNPSNTGFKIGIRRVAGTTPDWFKFYWFAIGY